MDIISHGLWGGLAFGRKNRKVFYLTFLFGIMPDIFSFGILWIVNLFGFYERPQWSQGPPPMESIPTFVSYLYNATHSLIIFLAIFSLIWFLGKKPFWPLGAWGLHIFIDIPSHSLAFFPTPFLWPISNFKVNGIQWGNPVIYIPNLVLLLFFYIWFFLAERKNKSLK